METIANWTEAFDELVERIGGRFVRSEARERARAYLQGLLSNIPRKNGWQMAEMLGEKTPYGLQQFLYRAKWEPEQVRDDLQRYVIEQIGERESVLVVDETGFLKKGRQSVGVQVQYCGTAGKTANCQVGVFLTYANQQGHTFLDRALQGCSVLKNSDIIKDVIKVHTVVKKFKTNIFDIVFPQNIEGKTPQLSKDMRISTNTRFVFTHGYVADIVIAILNAPMIADGLTKLLSTQNDGRNIEGGFIAVFPGFGFGVKHLPVTFNFNHNFDQDPLFVIG